MQFAFRQKAQMRGQRLQAIDCTGAFEEAGCVEFQRLDLEKAHMLVQARSPDQIDLVPDLQHRLRLARAPAADHAKVAPMRARHHLKYDAGFAMLAAAKDYALVAPFHNGSVGRSVRE